MSSHSRVKGKAKKSAASSARKKAARSAQSETSPPSTEAETNRQPLPLPAARDLDDGFQLSKDEIIAISAAANQQFHRSVGTRNQPATDFSTRVDQSLRGIHPTLAADAPRSAQAEQTLFTAIIHALLPFHDPKAS